jgi:single-stranded-DNA-specific exonuclease
MIHSGLVVERTLPLEAVFGEMKRALRALAPFGTGNPKPLFAFVRVVPSSLELFGKAKEHFKLVFQTEHGPLEAIAFFTLPTDFPRPPQAGEPCTLLAHIEESFFMGRRHTRLRIVDSV